MSIPETPQIRPYRSGWSYLGEGLSVFFAGFGQCIAYVGIGLAIAIGIGGCVGGCSYLTSKGGDKNPLIVIEHRSKS